MNNQRQDGIEIFVGVSVGYLLFCSAIPGVIAEVLAQILPGNYSAYYAVLSLTAGLLFVSQLYKMFLEHFEWKNNITGKGFLEALLTGIILFVAINFLVSPLLGGIFENSNNNYAENVQRMFETPIATFIQVVVIAPLLEELIYRGFLLKRALKQRKMVAAVLLVAGFFGVLHLSIVQGISAFIAGIILCLLYVKTESVTLCITAHSFYNGLTFFMTVILGGLR